MFRTHDAGNLLLGQARDEVLSRELDIRQLAATLNRMRGQRIEAVTLAASSPFVPPKRGARFREQLSTEKREDRFARIIRDAEKMADK